MLRNSRSVTYFLVVLYLAQLLTTGRLKPDPVKVKANASMPRPDDKRAIQRLLGCFIYPGSCHSSQVSKPLCKLTENNVMFTQDSSQEEAQQAIKGMISYGALLEYYDVASEISVQ